VIDPRNRSHMDLVKQREKWEYLGQSLDQIVKEEELARLLTTELPAYQRLEEAEEGKEVDKWWAEVAEVTLGDERQFPILSRFTTIITILTLTSILNRLALALCTVCNSSSEVERDFSDMEAIYADSRAHATGQELLEAKMMVKSTMKAEANNCARCIASKEDRRKSALAGEKLSVEQCQHCHCSFYHVDDELLAELRNSEPSKKSHKSELVKDKESKKVEPDSKKVKEIQEVKVKREVLQLKKNLKEKKGKEKEEKDKEKLLKDKEIKVTKKAAKKRVAIEKVDVTKKKGRLSFLL